MKWAKVSCSFISCDIEPETCHSIYKIVAIEEPGGKHNLVRNIKAQHIIFSAVTVKRLNVSRYQYLFSK